MAIFGKDIQVFIDTVDYTTLFYEASESGGEKEYSYIKMVNGDYRSILTGRSNYELTLSFRVDDVTLISQFEDNTEKEIQLILNNNEVSPVTTVTITYSYMTAKSLEITYTADGLVEGTLTFTSKPIVDGVDTREIL